MASCCTPALLYSEGDGDTDTDWTVCPGRRSADLESRTIKEGSCCCCGDSHPDVCANKEVMGLTVLCSARDVGCHWEGVYKAFDAHRDECQFITVSCPNTACVSRMQRRHVPHHLDVSCPLRAKQCPHCYDEMAFQDFEKHLKLICVKVKLDCPNGCGVLQARRDELRDHLKVCHLEKTRCDFSSRGCEYIGCRNTLGSHYAEASTYHSILVNRSLSLSQLSWEPIKRQSNENHQEQAVMKVRLQQLEKHNSELSQQVQLLLANSRTLVSEIQDLKLREKMTHEQLEAHLAECRSSGRSQADSVLVSSRRGSSGTAVSQPTSSDHSECAQVSTVSRDMRKVEDRLMQRVDIVDRSVAVQDIQLSDLTIRMDLNEVKGCKGVLLWRIADLRRRVQEASSGRTTSLYSPPFFTSMYGYKMCARIYLNGDGAGRATHVSLFFVIMRGEFDSLLPWPFQQKVKMTLLDQTPTTSQYQRNNITEIFRPNTSSSSFQRPTAEMNIATGCPQFAPLSSLSSDRFVRDDTLFVRIEVSQLGFKAPDHVAEAL